MTLPTGYTPPKLLPKIVIKDRDGATQYTYDAFGTQDVKLSQLGLHGGIGTDHGSLDLVLIDDQNLLTDSTIRGRDVLIKPQWTVELDFGNSQPELTNWFDGILYDAGVDRPFNGMQTVHLVAFGKGITWSERLTQMKRIQMKAADGLTEDDTDNTAKGTEIMKDLFEDKDHYLHHGLAVPTGFTTTGIVDFSAKLADFQKDAISISNAAQEVANRMGMVWGIDLATQEIFMHFRGSKDSGLLITNDLSSQLTSSWDKSKLCIRRNRLNGWRDSTIGFGYSILVGKGVLDNLIQYENTSANATLNLDTFDAFAFPFTAKSEDVSRISLFLSRVGTLTKPLTISIYADNGTPEPEEIIRTVQIEPDYLQEHIPVAGEYFEYPFRTINEATPLTINDPYYVVIEGYDNGANDIRIDYQTGTGTYYTRTAGVWSSAVGDAKMRVYHSHPVDIIFENLQAKKKFGTRELSIPLGDFPTIQSATDAIRNLSRLLGKTNRTFKPITATPPTAPPKLGQKARLVDTFNGLNQFVDLIGYDLRLDAYGNSATGVDEIVYHMEDIFY